MRKLFLPLILAAFAFSACNGQPTQATHINTPVPISIPTSSEPTTAELEITNPSQPIQVSAGSEFTITVKTERSPTDKHWEIAKELDSNVVEYVWKDYVPDKPDDENSSGKEIWRFKAVGPGQTTITLGYYQGMTDVAPQKRDYTIVVK